MNELLEHIIKPYIKKPQKQFCWEKRIWLFRISIYILRNKYCFRFEISNEKEWQ